jgi:hypothetical protein
MTNITWGVQRWINKLESLKESVWKTAFIDTLNEAGTLFQDILWAEANSAIVKTEEYDIPEFREPLKRAIYTEGCIHIRKAYGEYGVQVRIDLNKTAGQIDDYAQAVRTARENLERDERGWRESKIRASWFWRNFIYGQAREGVKIKAKRVEGQRGRTPLRQREGEVLYERTIAERIAHMTSLAPYWSLIDKGNVNNAPMHSGGVPYPSNGPTHFVDKAETKIRILFEKMMEENITNLSSELEIQEYGSNGLIDQIGEVVQLAESRSGSWTPGEILRRLELGGRNYELYITGTSRLGMRLTR